MPNRLASVALGSRLAESAIFFATSNFDLKYFWSLLSYKKNKVPHLKDLIHICLEPEAQGWGMTFNRFYVGSNLPYFISLRDEWVYLFCRGCTMLMNKNQATRIFSLYSVALREQKRKYNSWCGVIDWPSKQIDFCHSDVLLLMVFLDYLARQVQKVDR